MEHCLALDFLLSKQGGGGMCHRQYLLLHIYKNFKHCRGHADYTLQQAKWLREQSLETQVSTQVWDQIKSWLPSRTWFLPFLGPILAIICLLLFGSCILNLLVKFVSSHLEFIKVQTPLMKMKMTYYRGPIDNPFCGQPWCCRPLHHPLSTGSSYWIDFLVSIPNSDHWERGMKEWRMDCRRSQKVINAQGDTFP
jgi:hypothetical protein